MEVDRRGMLECGCLGLDAANNLRVAVAAGYRDDAGKQVEIPPPGLVEQVLHLPFDDHQRFAVQSEQCGIHVSLPQCQNLSTRRTLVRSRRVGELWHRQRWPHEVSHRQSREVGSTTRTSSSCPPGESTW